MARRADASIRIERILRTAEPLFFIWLALLLIGILADQIALLPSKPPTPAERRAATPRAQADWALVRARLAVRFPEPPLELGEVWTTPTGRICGLVNPKEAGVDYMTRFYTVGLAPVLQEEDPHRYFRDWMDCVDTRWVELHRGPEKTGICASAFGRTSFLGRQFCGPAG